MTTQLLLVITAMLVLGCSVETSETGANHERGLPAPELATTPARPLRLLVIGGTNGIGLQTVELALQRGHHVTALARRPERMTTSHPRLQAVAGDILDYASIASTIAGQDAIVIAVGMGPTREPVTLFSEGARNVMDGMIAAGVHRLVTVTGIGAGPTRGHGGFFYDKLLLPLALQTIYADKDRQEALIRDYGDRGAIDWTIVRPGFLNDDDARQQYRVITDLAGVTAGDIPRADVAHFILAAIESNNFLGQSPLLSE